jgi:hypothetical protein
VQGWKDSARSCVLERKFRLSRALIDFPETSGLKRFQVGNDRPDLIRLEHKLWHRGVSRHDPFCQSFGQVFNRIAFMKGAERRRLWQRAISEFLD